jgi:hypothetical protein
MKSSTGLMTMKLIALILVLSSCSKQLLTNGGGYSDVSLTRNSSEYEIKRLKEINVEGTSFWGIPSKKNNPNKDKTGLIVRFNGLSIGRVPKFFPILSMIGLTLITGDAIQSIAGHKDLVSGSYTFKGAGDYRLGIIPSTLLAIPIAGAFNNWIWDGISIPGASNELNYRLVSENPNVDVFMNPKYKIQYHLGWWKQTANINAKVMGATIKTN